MSEFKCKPGVFITHPRASMAVVVVSVSISLTLLSLGLWKAVELLAMAWRFAKGLQETTT